MYRLTIFHYLVKHSPENILYNTLTGNMLWVNDAFVEAYSKLQPGACVSDEVLIQLFKDNELVSRMKTEGILVPEELDEISIIRKQREDIRSQDTATNVEFIVTYGCNLNCVYCYAIREKKAMPPDIAHSASNFVMDFALKRKSKDMRIQFIGGEPLLNMQAIEIIVERMLVFKNINGINMETSLTTNGVLMDKSVIELIRRLGKIQVQVTLDGPEEIHNSRRILHNGNSYRLLMDNMAECKSLIDELVIRINVDHDNIEQCPALLQELADNGLQDASLTIVPTFSHTDQCSHYDMHCFTKEEVRDEVLQISRKALEFGFAPSWNPLPTYISCGALFYSGALAVDPYGSVYKCAACYGDKIHIVGDILNGLNTSPGSLYGSYGKRDDRILDIDKCRQCPSLPICSGGCAFRAERNSGTIFSPDCNFDKLECLEDFVRLYADWYRKEEFTVFPKVRLVE
ncbi:SPASM domain-containing protein [Candidatus Woesearchaeota archaeon]|nr:SPASM domain-containing protein [Candidatus Woesearchaeota archaeon]